MTRHTDAPAEAIPDEIRADVETLWLYHDMHHELQPCDAGIGLGSHDLGVAVIATRLFHEGLFPRIVFTRANAPTTVERFPRGEAVHYREYAVGMGCRRIRFSLSRMRRTRRRTWRTRASCWTTCRSGCVQC